MKLEPSLFKIKESKFKKVNDDEENAVNEGTRIWVETSPDATGIVMLTKIFEQDADFGVNPTGFKDEMRDERSVAESINASDSIVLR